MSLSSNQNTRHEDCGNVDNNWELPETRIDPRLESFDQIFVRHPKVELVARRFVSLIGQTRATILRNEDRTRSWGQGSAKVDEMSLLPLIGPSGSGKSKTIQAVSGKIHESRSDPKSIPILVVTLRASIRHTRELQASILEAFRDPSASAVRKMQDYSEAAVNEAIIRIARKKGTTLVVLDEGHNALLAADAKTIAQALKSLLNDGVFSIVLSGTEDMRSLFSHVELRERSKPPISFSPPKVGDIEGCLEFFRFTERLCDIMHSKGIVSLPFQPMRKERQCAALFEMAEGNLGRAAKIIRRGLEHAFDEGLTSLHWDSLAEAHARWLELQGLSYSWEPTTSSVAMVRRVVENNNAHR